MTTTEAPATQHYKDVSDVLAHVDQGEALRARIKDLQDQLKIHEDAIKECLGEAVAGTDAGGRVVVRFPHRNRAGFDKAKAKDKMSPTDYAECETVTPYRTLLYGAG